MFDIGFWELMLIGIVALVVIGPDRLPGVARTVGRWVGRARRFVSNVKSDIEREIRDEELRKALDRDANLDEIKKIIEDSRFTIEDEVRDTQDYVVRARDDNPGSDSQDKLLKEQEDEFERDEYGSGDHVDLGADEYDEPINYGDKFPEPTDNGKQTVKDDRQNDKSKG
jgi:sec-independent protein translocase protein TatB